MPIISGLVAAASVAAATAGVAESAGNSATASKGAQLQDQIAQQDNADKQQAFQQAESFYSPYTKSGSPYLQNTQSQAAGQNAQQFGNAAGQLRQQQQTSGLGYGPSGNTAAAIGQLGQGAAQSSSSNYLANLLNNEQVKFQAQQGITNAGQMLNGTPMPTNQVTQTTTGSSVNALGQSLANLAGQNPMSNPATAQQQANTNAGLNTYTGLPQVSGPMPAAGGTPTTQGFGV